MKKRLVSATIASVLFILISVTVMANDKGNKPEPVSQPVLTDSISIRTEVLEDGSQVTKEINLRSPKNSVYKVEKYSYIPDEIVAE